MKEGEIGVPWKAILSSSPEGARTNPECLAYKRIQWYGKGSCTECREKLQECVILW